MLLETQAGSIGDIYHSGAEGATKYFSILCFFGFRGKF
jgi:hypothetical protein